MPDPDELVAICEKAMAPAPSVRAATRAASALLASGVRGTPG